MKYTNYLFASVMILLFCASLYFLIPAYISHRETRAALYQIHEDISHQDMEMEQLKKEITALRSDHRAIERVAREKFGWCKEGETVYHFDEPAPAVSSNVHQQ